jgi:ribosomal-protein-alanine N-acetyltransferase
MNAEIKTRLNLGPGLRVRSMTYEDLPRVGEVERGAYAFPWSEGIFRDCIRVGYMCRVLEDRGEMIGHAVMSIGAGEAHVLNVCVRLDYRDQGHGRYLMHMMFDVARAAGAQDMFLEVRPSNPSAIHLYESLGFHRVGIRKNYYQASGPDGLSREDAWVYKRSLGGTAA